MWTTTTQRASEMTTSSVMVDAERILDSTPSRDVNTSLSLDYHYRNNS
jgi:hypothetical protein